MTARFAAVAAMVALAVAAASTGEAAAAGPEAKGGGASAPARAGAKPAARAASAASAPASAAAAAPVEFLGVLESGKTYVAEFAFDNNALHIWRPKKEVKVPPNHAWTIAWANLDKFPALKTAATRARPQRFVFRVASVDISSGSPAIPWTTIYRCEVLAVEAVAGPQPAAGKRK